VLAFFLLGVFLISTGIQTGYADDDPPRIWVPDGAPTRIVIPKIGVDSTITPVGIEKKGRRYQWQTVKEGVAWHNLSSLPGTTGNLVLSGHNGSRGNKVFRNLHRLKVGDTFQLYADDQVFEYVVTKRLIMRYLFINRKKKARYARLIGPTPDERVTLVTCHPWWTNTHRLVIIARPVRLASPSIDWYSRSARP